jgi:hypothetical protein
MVRKTGYKQRARSLLLLTGGRKSEPIRVEDMLNLVNTDLCTAGDNAYWVHFIFENFRHFFLSKVKTVKSQVGFVGHLQIIF